MHHSSPSLAVSVGFLLGASVSSVFGQKVYWTSLGEARFTGVGALNRTDLDGTNAEELIADGVGRFVVDSARGQVYWLSDEDSIRRANLDGTNVEEVLPTRTVYPEGIATYGLVSFLVETTTRLSVGLEPMLKGWSLPYRDQAS